ncbi:MAG TPA: TAT-variant-translocated molybdopterin oxidoreductase [Vicinamibacterales bacterium]|jgi:molybdopterin-containing oxidoreductase family iron-sulfur binding subunit|nr:TAT-variant-translocated molybdopterin oxidoreductase [Vicinamibacterales bacterium]
MTAQRAGLKAHAWWRTLEEQADTPEFQERLYKEFPSQIEAIADPVARRAFLKLMGASMALAGITACTRQPEEKIVPYVRQPEEMIPGKPLFYATAMTLGGIATGVLVETHEGRPTKIEGNPDHPSSLGAADVFAQAAVLELYDPDRVSTVTNLGEIRPWPAFIAAIRAALTAQQAVRGAGLRILTEAVGSPTLAAQLRDLLARFPAATWHQWDPASRENAKAGAKAAFGEYVDARHHFDRADVILSLDANFLSSGPGCLRASREFASRRRPENIDRMNRLYVVETMPTSTGARADHRLPAPPSDVAAIAHAIAYQTASLGSTPSTLDAHQSQWAAAVATDLLAHRGASLVVAGESQPPVVHALAHAMNAALDNVGKTVEYIEPCERQPIDQLASLRELTAELRGGKVDVLVILGGNPVYTAPADLGFSEALDKAPLRVHLSLHEDETSARCHWQIPEAHFLEAWSDATSDAGTISIVQPVIAPLYGGKSAHEVIAAMTDRPEESGHDVVRGHWMAQGAADFEPTWRRWLHDGVMAGTSAAAKHVSVNTDAIRDLVRQSASSGAPSGTQIAFRLDPTVFDGRFANNGWLQELPKPITKLTWDNAVLMSPATAASLSAEQSLSFQGGEHGQTISDVVELTVQGRTIRGAVFVVPGHAERAITVHLGYGRSRTGHVGTGAGFNAYALRTSGALWSSSGVRISKTRDQYALACTQAHHLMEGRGLVRAVTRDEYQRDPQSIREGDDTPPKTLTLYQPVPYEGYKWGMAIDVNACTGCNACIVGCQSENNIAVVGKEQVLRGREMHWLRVDSYYRGPADNPETYFQPVPCMQCENAPCEVVCPVGATSHSSEGLNDMVYNRCVGTRYCSNNCPYKVRRFNFLLYQDWDTPSLKLGRNPDVTVRSRGVMEKCTYCVQRINEAKITAEKEDRKVRDGDIKTACQQTCPADAIVFGDLNDPQSRVTKLKAEVRNYALLGELNTRPRTTYLGAVRNVNPELGE